MCRLAAIPPGMTAEEALEIVTPFGAGNKDGTGVAYSDGKTVHVVKTPKDLKTALDSKVPIFDHLPSKHWTIFHVRLATHGEVCELNTHPFVHDGMAFVHNGIYSPHNIVRAALGDRINPRTPVDSDVGSAFLRLLGPERFCEVNKDCYGGVFLGLTPTGGLWVSVLSGDMEYAKVEGRYVLASSLPSKYRDTTTVDKGWMIFENDGSYRKGKFTEKYQYKWKDHHRGHYHQGSWYDADEWGYFQDGEWIDGKTDKKKEAKKEDVKPTKRVWPD